MAEALDYFLIQNLLNRYSDAVDRGDFAAQLRKWTRVYPETGNPRTRHLCTNPIIDFVVFQAAESFPLQPIITGSYVDRFEKVGGSWRFAERRELVGQAGDLSAHLLRPFEGPTGE
jgi:hypothetical protein